MNEETYNLIAKILSGEGSDADRRELEAWLATAPQNRAEYESMQALWADTDALFSAPATFDTAAAWQAVAARTVDAPADIDAEAPAAPRRARVIPMWLSGSLAAAAVVLLGFFAFRHFSAPDTITVLADAGNKVVTLPDQSTVTLKKGSSLRYASEFDGAERNVSLDGEAFFEVTKDPAHPFVIDAQSASVRVLGTSFDVKCTEQGAVVNVATGKVRMTQKSNGKASVDLLPGDRGELAENKLSQSKHAVEDKSYLYWSTGELKFEQTALKDVLAAISAATDTEITMDAALPAELQQLPITSSFDHQSVASILADLRALADNRIQIVPEGAGYRIRAAQ